MKLSKTPHKVFTQWYNSSAVFMSGLTSNCLSVAMHMTAIFTSIPVPQGTPGNAGQFLKHVL